MLKSPGRFCLWDKLCLYRLTLAPSDHWTFRYKFLWQAPLTSVTLVTDSHSESIHYGCICILYHVVITGVTALQRYRSRASMDRSGARLVQDEATLVKMLEMAKSLGIPHQVVIFIMGFL